MKRHAAAPWPHVTPEIVLSRAVSLHTGASTGSLDAGDLLLVVLCGLGDHRRVSSC